MKNKKLLWILPLMFLLVISLASATTYLDNSADSTTGWITIDGFNVGTFGVDTTNKVEGTGSLSIIDASSSSSSYARKGYQFTTPLSGTDEVNASFYIRASTTSSLMEWNLREESSSSNTYISDVPVALQITDDVFRIYDGTSYLEASSKTPSANTWYKIDIVFNMTSGSSSGVFDVYIDSSLQFNNVRYGYVNVTPDYISFQATGSGDQGTGWIDDILIESASSESPNFEVSVVDQDDSAVVDISIDVDGSNYLNVTGSTITTTLYQNDTLTYNVYVNATDYFSKVYSSVDVSSNLEAVLHQSEISFASYELITNNSISNCTYTINSQENTTFYLSSGEHTVLAECSTYDALNHTFNVTPLDNKTINIESLTNLLLNITVEKIRDSTPISNFTGTLYNAANNYSVIFNSTDNLSQVPLLRNLDYQLILDPVGGYATNYGLEQNISSSMLNVSNYAVVFQLYENNSVLFNFKNADTGAFITDTVNATLFSANNTYNFNTSTGSYFLDSIAGDTYTMTASSSGFNDVSVFITVLNNEFQTLNVFFGGDVVAKTFFTVDNRGLPVSGVVVSFTREINGSTVVYGQEISDFSGAIQIYLNEATLYSFTAAKAGYDTFSGDVTPFLDTYNINLQLTGDTRFVSTFDDIQYSADIVYNYPNVYAAPYYQILSNAGYLQYYGMNITYNGTNYFQNNSGTPAGGTITFNVTNINTTLDPRITVDYWFKSINHTLASWSETYYLIDVNATGNNLANDGLSPQGMTESGKVVLAGFILLVLVGGGLAMSKRMLVGAVMGMIGTGVLWYKEFLPPQASLLALIVLFMLLIVDVITGENK